MLICENISILIFYITIPNKDAQLLSSNESSTNIVSPAVALKPTRIPRRPRSKIALPSGKHGTLDNFVTRRNESPATKRKHSTESSSPSSVQVAKTTKTDGSDEVS